MTDYDELAAGNGWTITRETVQGQSCTVYQRGREIAVRVPAPEGRWTAGLYDGRIVGDIANYLVSSPRREMLTQHIEGDREGVIARLAAMSAERKIQARTSGTQRETRRLSDEAEGIDLAVHVMQAWVNPS